jgi:hypothetical protein
MSAELKSNVISVDAPIEGWDAFHSLDNMPPNAAIILDNLIPGAGRVDGRGGYLIFADLGTGTPVETVASLHSITDNQLVAASGGGLWSMDSGTLTGTPVQIAAPGTYSSDRWQWSNFRKADENGILILNNGVDNTQIYDGTAIADIDTTGSDPGTPTAFIGSLVFKGRVYYWAEDDDAFYYSQAGSYQGVLSKFDLGAQAQRGGKIMDIVSWTVGDAGDGKDDYIVFLFDTGEVLIYQGDDPETAGFFEMMGRYYMGEPISRRGTEQYGSDTIVMTKDGYVNLASVVQQGRTSDVPQFSHLIHRAMIQRTQTRSQLHGWQATLLPRKGLFLFNVPLSSDTFEQHVMNTVTQRWCRFKDLNVNCMCVHNERLYGGAQDGTIYIMFESTSDNGVSIQFGALPAFNYMGDPGVHKHLVAAQFVSNYRNPKDVQITGYADFRYPTTLSPVVPEPYFIPSTWSVNPHTPPSEIGSFWDTDFWSGDESPQTTLGWQNVSGFGYAVTVAIRFTEASNPVVWRSTGIRYFLAGAQ